MQRAVVLRRASRTSRWHCVSTLRELVSCTRSGRRCLLPHNAPRGKGSEQGSAVGCVLIKCVGSVARARAAPDCRQCPTHPHASVAGVTSRTSVSALPAPPSAVPCLTNSLPRSLPYNSLPGSLPYASRTNSLPGIGSQPPIQDAHNGRGARNARPWTSRGTC